MDFLLMNVSIILLVVIWIAVVFCIPCIVACVTACYYLVYCGVGGYFIPVDTANMAFPILATIGLFGDCILWRTIRIKR